MAQVIQFPFSLQNISENQTLPTPVPHRGAASVHFQSPDSGNKHHHMRAETRIPAFDVKELFHSNVCSESCFSHCHEKSNCKNAIPTPLMLKEKTVYHWFCKSTNLQTLRDQQAWVQSGLQWWRNSRVRCWQMAQHEQILECPVEIKTSWAKLPILLQKGPLGKGTKISWNPKEKDFPRESMKPPLLDFSKVPVTTMRKNGKKEMTRERRSLTPQEQSALQPIQEGRSHPAHL